VIASLLDIGFVQHIAAWGNRLVLMIRNPQTSPTAVALWNQRADALRAGSVLLADKPDRTNWTNREFRIWRYATAISHRLEKLQ
jgi:hypothetical protein